MKPKPIQLQLPFTDSIEGVNAELNEYYVKLTKLDLEDKILDYKDQIFDWSEYYE